MLQNLIDILVIFKAGPMNHTSLFSGQTLYIFDCVRKATNKLHNPKNYP